jgi:hypothetical protein
LEGSQSSSNPERHNSDSTCRRGDKLLDKRARAKAYAEKIAKLELFVDKVKTKTASWDDARNFARVLNEIAMQTFDEALASRWVWGDKKGYMQMFRGIYSMAMATVESHLNLCEQIENLNKAVIDLSDKMGKNQVLTNEQKQTLDNIKESLQERMNKILDSPAVKLANQMIQESESARKRLDKTRQDVIHDSVV